MQIWKCDQERSAYLVHEFFKSPYFLDGIPAMPGTTTLQNTALPSYLVSSTAPRVNAQQHAGAKDALQRLKPHTELVVVTSRQNVIQEVTRDWVDTNFPDIFSEVHFGNHWAKSGASRSKSDMCLDVGADILIDDNPRYAYECATKGMDVLLYNWKHQYPWAQQPPEYVLSCVLKKFCATRRCHQSLTGVFLCRLQHEKITVVSDWDEIEEFFNNHEASSSVDLNYQSL